MTEELSQKLSAAQLRHEVDFRNESLGRKIRDAQLLQVPLMVVVGKQECRSRLINVRTISGEKFDGIEIDEFVESCAKGVSEFASKIVFGT